MSEPAITAAIENGLPGLREEIFPKLLELRVDTDFVVRGGFPRLETVTDHSSEHLVLGGIELVELGPCEVPRPTTPEQGVEGDGIEQVDPATEACPLTRSSES